MHVLDLHFTIMEAGRITPPQHAQHSYHDLSSRFDYHYRYPRMLEVIGIPSTYPTRLDYNISPIMSLRISAMMGRFVEIFPLLAPSTAPAVTLPTFAGTLNGF